ncbi:hypothetical protein BC939DRAFT_441571 [Gamsiella multidivaricata]|uniref:uncharacterized protein n=1 Tax=Gamsiella multidivaricata TaxID=101098 RepID=UPI00221FDF2B|nr:uncharacterized protein BC939DRAFT_441571 [Gamsiella multidivaricata]KAG0364189.1 hypothetical protein BGZ54_007766 [Gamsiella multidivaricata]KAI7829330.1 hypothetical protein BC939DRAFT_441571 [Gamsiella multidivaricata]
MKFSVLSLSALLSTLVYSASAASSPEAPATVYFYSHGRPSTSGTINTNNGNKLPSLSLKETRATLAHLMNLGQLTKDETFVDMHGPIQQVFDQPGMARKDLFETMGGNLVMVVEGVHSPQDLLPSFDPAFTVDSSEGLQDVITELGNTVPSQDRYLFNTHKSSKSGDALVNEHLVAVHHADVDVSVFDLNKRADALFLEESESLSNYFESYKKTHNKHDQDSDFVRITLKGLAALAAEHGVDSVQYKAAQQILKEFLQLILIPEFEQIHKTYTTTFILVAPTTNHLGSELHEDFSSTSPFSHNPLRKRALPSTGNCFATEADCQANTNGCNQHGACVLSTAANCYHCKCEKIDNTQYGGNTCDKIDISIQFHLFFWLGLGLILAVVLAVGLILQMGNQSQGGVPVGPTRAELKRD